MKLKISLALNFLLLIVVGVLIFREIGGAIGHDYYQKMVGNVAGSALDQLKRGNADLTRSALEEVHRDPSESGIIAAGKKLGITH